MNINPETTGEMEKGRSIKVIRNVLPLNSNLATAQAAAKPNTTFIGTAMADALRRFGAEDETGKKLVFGQVSLLIGVALASTSVGLFGPPLLLFYLSLGMMVGKEPMGEGAPAAAAPRPTTTLNVFSS